MVGGDGAFFHQQTPSPPPSTPTSSQGVMAAITATSHCQHQEKVSKMIYPPLPPVTKKMQHHHSC
eukprot:7922352-Ditylum_brightwellii.AAC.1